MIRHHRFCLALSGLLLPLLASCAAPPVAATPASVATQVPAATASTDPAWVTKLIGELEAQPLSNPPASIVRYDYAGSTVYYLPAKCCDFPSVLLDAGGQKLCSPDGGITGRGDGQCPDFRTTRSQEQLIWKDKRERAPRR